MTAPHFQPGTDDAAPRPWRSISGDSQICDKNGMFVADVAQGISGTCWPTSRANARLTVEAVNNHETLKNNVEVMKRHMSGAADELAALRSRVEELTKALEKIHTFPYVGFNASRQMALIAGSALPLEDRK